jgi:hypothetical protein
VVDDAGVAEAGVDGQAEHVVQAPGVTAAGQGLGEDPVVADRAAADAGTEQQLDPADADVAQLYGAAAVNEQVGAGGIGPGGVAVVRAGRDAFADRVGQGDLAAVAPESTAFPTRQG